MDTLSNALSKIMNAEKVGRKTAIIYPVSNVIRKIFDILAENGYIGGYKEIKDNKGNSIEINLIGMINKCGTIRPNFYIKLTEMEKFEKRYLPSKDFGILILSATAGIITNNQAKEKKLGGKLLVYCY